MATDERDQRSSFRAAIDSLATRRVLLFGGKGGVGKTTIASAAAMHLASAGPVILFTTDPASNLTDLFDASIPGLSIEQLDSGELYASFLREHIEQFVELGDRGTYLDREELRRLFELALPGADELMAWMRIGELVEKNEGSTIVVDTAPTGHTLRMLASGGHFEQLAAALDAMQAKHRDMVRQFARRESRDSLDLFIEEFAAKARRRHELFTDAGRTAFIAVTLSEPWVLEQTTRLVVQVRDHGIDVPFLVLNRAIEATGCQRDGLLVQRDCEAIASLRPDPVVKAVRSCVPLDSAKRIAGWLSDAGSLPATTSIGGPAPDLVPLRAEARLIFFAGKGGTGKTTSATSLALQLALRNPERHYTVISVDPAHTLTEVFEREAPPSNLTVETIDTRQKWRRFRETLGLEIEHAIDAFTPRGMTVAHDGDAVKKLIDVAPPGADELFAITRLADLIADSTQRAIVVDTAPTGHFLRLLDLPRTAGLWVREFMRILLRYRELITPGSLGEELVRASRSLHALERELHSERTAVVVVTRPERIVVAETLRLLRELEERRIAVGGVVVNYVTPEGGGPCDQSMRLWELEAMAVFEQPVVMVERRDAPVTSLTDLTSLLPVT